MEAARSTEMLVPVCQIAFHHDPEEQFSCLSSSEPLTLHNITFYLVPKDGGAPHQHCKFKTLKRSQPIKPIIDYFLPPSS
jgi:hypothetical protein